MERIVKYTTPKLTVVQMPGKKTADYGPSPRDDQGNVSFESHQPSPTDLNSPDKNTNNLVLTNLLSADLLSAKETSSLSQILEFNETIAQNLNQKTGVAEECNIPAFDADQSSQPIKVNTYKQQRGTRGPRSTKTDSIQQKTSTKGLINESSQSNLQKSIIRNQTTTKTSSTPKNTIPQPADNSQQQFKKVKSRAEISTNRQPQPPNVPKPPLATPSSQTSAAIKSQLARTPEPIIVKQIQLPSQQQTEKSQNQSSAKREIPCEQIDLAKIAQETFSIQSQQATMLEKIREPQFQSNSNCQNLFSQYQSPRLNKPSEQIKKQNFSGQPSPSRNVHSLVQKPQSQTLNTTAVSSKIQTRTKRKVSPGQSHHSQYNGSSQSSLQAVQQQFADKKAHQLFVQLGLSHVWKTKNTNQTYSRVELCEIAQKFSQKLSEMESLVTFEKARFKQLRQEIIQQQKMQQALHPSLKLSEANVKQDEGIVQLLRQGYEALKQSMVHNLTFLECYKDLQSYVSNNYFGQGDSNNHLQAINRIIHEQHKLDQMQINTDVVENVRDLFEQTLKQKQITIQSQIKAFQDPEYFKDALNSSENQLSRALFQSTLSLFGCANRHQNCLHDHGQSDTFAVTTMLKNELQMQKLQVVKLREERESLRRKIVNLKSQLSQSKSLMPTKNLNTIKSQQQLQSLDLLQQARQTVSVQQLNRLAENTGNELQSFKAEQITQLQQIQQLKDSVSASNKQNELFQRLLHDRAEMEKLERTVGELTAMLISKNVKDLSAQQKAILQAVFGDSTTLHTLQHELNKAHSFNDQLQSWLKKCFALCCKLDKRVKQVWQSYKKFVTDNQNNNEEIDIQFESTMLHQLRSEIQGFSKVLDSEKDRSRSPVGYEQYQSLEQSLDQHYQKGAKSTGTVKNSMKVDQNQSQKDYSQPQVGKQKRLSMLAGGVSNFINSTARNQTDQQNSILESMEIEKKSVYDQSLQHLQIVADSKQVNDYFQEQDGVNNIFQMQEEACQSEIYPQQLQISLESNTTDQFTFLLKPQQPSQNNIFGEQFVGIFKNVEDSARKKERVGKQQKRLRKSTSSRMSRETSMNRESDLMKLKLLSGNSLNFSQNEFDLLKDSQSMPSETDLPNDF